MTIDLETHGPVTLLRIRGGKANAMNQALLDDLHVALDRVKDAPALVFTGEGNAFSAGLALPELIDLDATSIGTFIDRFETVMHQVLTFPGATVAAINGHAIAGGCVLALMCDTRVMVNNSTMKIGLNEVALGIGLPATVMEPLRLRVPPQSLAMIALDGTLFGPYEAQGVHLVDEVITAERLVPRCIEIATPRAAHPIAYAQIKQAMLWQTVDALNRTRAQLRDRWVETWFSKDAQTTLRAAVARITKR
jgi:enoyl-CoA hydratase